MAQSHIVSKAWQRGLFDGLVVFCTGGSGDLCSAQVRALVYLGVNACIVGRNEEKAKRVASEIASCRPGARVLGLGNVDVRKFDSLDQAAKKCVDELGGIDFLIAGAAGNFLAPVMQISNNGFRSVVEIDLFGAWHAFRVTTPYLLQSVKKHGSLGGRIIFVSSTMGYTGTQLITHAAVAKAGIDSLSNQIALELGPRGIRSNVLAPGPIEGTEGIKRLIGPNRPRTIPLGQLGTTQNIADATVFLFSDAGSYVNGATLVVDGGAWRTAGASGDSELPYPETVLTDEPPKLAQRSKI